MVRTRTGRELTAANVTGRPPRQAARASRDAALELPPAVFPVAGLCVGYPSQAGWISMRLPTAVTVHTDRYDDSDLSQELERYDRRREARHATPRESQRFADQARYGVVYCALNTATHPCTHAGVPEEMER